ncbi:peroxiredoxin family protein [Candidatus Lucifugimonas marina]|uniref:peroxiredoxin family protein n=1 Tax=Candidatus Lucifugimonas marina TaxID=3038979 RepID=UPI00319E4CD8
MNELSRKYSLLIIAISLLATAVACSNSSAQAPTPTPSPIPSPTAEGPSATVGTSEASEYEKLPLAPVFSVASIDDEEVRLENLLGTVPVYLLFIPSTTDELDISQLKNIQANLQRFEKSEAEVVVIVADLPTRVIDMRDELGLEFALIADPLHVVASDWQVLDLDNDGNTSPASFVFDAHGSLIARLVASEPADRPSINEVLHAIQESLKSGTA